MDDVVSEKPFAKLLPWATWTYSHTKKQQGYGCHVVLLSWTSDPAGTWRIPVAFRPWRPKRSCAPGQYQKKTDLGVAMLREVVAAGCPAAYVVGDTAYTGGQVSKTATHLGLVWVGTSAPRTTVVSRGRRQHVQHLALRLKRKWRPKLGVRAMALLVDAPSLGPVRLVVLKHEHGNQARARERRVPGPGHQRPDLPPRLARASQAEPMADRNHFPRYETVGRTGRLPVLGGSGAGPACRARLPRLRRVAGAPPRATSNRGGGQGPLARRGPARRPDPASTTPGRPARVSHQVTA